MIVIEPWVVWVSRPELPVVLISARNHSSASHGRESIKSYWPNTGNCHPGWEGRWRWKKTEAWVGCCHILAKHSGLLAEFHFGVYEQ